MDGRIKITVFLVYVSYLLASNFILKLARLLLKYSVSIGYRINWIQGIQVLITLGRILFKTTKSLAYSDIVCKKLCVISVVCDLYMISILSNSKNYTISRQNLYTYKDRKQKMYSILKPLCSPVYMFLTPLKRIVTLCFYIKYITQIQLETHTISSNSL